MPTSSFKLWIQLLKLFSNVNVHKQFITTAGMKESHQSDIVLLYYIQVLVCYCCLLNHVTRMQHTLLTLAREDTTHTHRAQVVWQDNMAATTANPCQCISSSMKLSSSLSSEIFSADSMNEIKVRLWCSEAACHLVQG